MHILIAHTICHYVERRVADNEVAP
jgi:hypothetical protein